MLYAIYKITNQINGKFYIGSHKTKNLNDSYMGSGKYLKYAQKKYGIENFTKEILFVFDTPEKMYAKEAELVNKDFLAEENTYNLKVGGFGGFDHVNSSGLNTSWKDPENRSHKISESQKRRILHGGKLSNQFKANSGVRHAAFVDAVNNGTFKGKHHTDESKSKIGARNSVSQKGAGNSQFGTRWIFSSALQVSKKIQKTDPLPDGWTEGRKLKF